MYRSNIGYQTESFIEHIENLPDDTYWSALEADDRQRLKDLNAAKSCHDNLKQLRKDYLDKLYGIIGEFNLKGYQEEQKRRIEGMRNARLQCSPTYDGYVHLEKLRKSYTEISKEFFKQLGIDLNEVATLQREYQEKTQAVFSGTIRKGKEAYAIPSEKNQTYTPPYNGSRWWYSWEKTDVDRVATPAHARWLDRHTGDVGSYTNLRVEDSGEHDQAHIIYHTGVRQWHRMTNTGHLLIRANFEPIEDIYAGRIVDEAGSSSIDLMQDVQVYARTVYPSPIVFDSAYGRFRGDPYHAGGGPFRVSSDLSRHDTISWSQDWLSGGTVYLRIPENFEKDDWLLVEVGIENYSSFTAEDCSANSYQTVRYFMREIGISSTHD